MPPLSLRSLLVCALLLFARTATAAWSESGNVQIIIVGSGGNEAVEAADIEVQDEIVQVSVDGGGEFTVGAEGNGNDRKVLGNIYIYHGTGNINSVIGTIGADVAIGFSAAPTSTAGRLNIFNSDLEDSSAFAVYQGTLSVIASSIGLVEVFEDADLYTSLGSRLAGLRTKADSYTSLEESRLLSNYECQLWGTVFIKDSVVRCRKISVANPGGSPSNVDLQASLGSAFPLETTAEFEVSGGTVDIDRAVATTGKLIVGPYNAYVGIAASQWTNAGGTTVQRGGDLDRGQLVIGAGTDFHELADVRVAGAPAWQHLTVYGAGSELEIDGDLRIGEVKLTIGDPLDSSGNVTVSNGATVIVHGELLVRSQGVLTIESGATVYAASVAGAGTITENGGTLVVPEPTATLGGVAALAACMWRARGRRS